MEDKINLIPPWGSKIEVKKGIRDNLELTYPAKGVTGYSIIYILFAGFWFWFTIDWALDAAESNVYFSLFTIPLWLGGFNLIIGIINSANGIQIVTFSDSKLIVKKVRPILPLTYELTIKHIQSVKVTKYEKRHFFKNIGLKQLVDLHRFLNGTIKSPAIITDGKTECFFEEASELEQEWVTSTLNSLIKQKKVF